MEQFSPRAIGIGKLNIRRHALRNSGAKEIFTTSKEAELLFNQEQLPGSGSPTPEYEQRALAERTKIAKLRALRLAREAERASRSEEASVGTEKLTQLKSPKTLRRHAGIRSRAVS